MIKKRVNEKAHKKIYELINKNFDKKDTLIKISYS